MRRRPATPARSIRWRRASCRSRSARRRRPCPTPSTARRPTASRCAGASRPTPTTPRAQVVRTSDERPTARRDRGAAADFTGEIMQVPPAFSAIKIDGERAYDLARSGEVVELEPRRIVIERPAAGRHAGRGDRRVRGRLRQGHLRARARARHGPRARLPRPCHRAAAHARRRLRRGCVGRLGDAAGGGGGGRRSAAHLLLRSRRRSTSCPGSASARTTRPACARPGGADARARCADPHGAAYAHFKGRILALGELEKGALRPTRVFNFG